MRLHPRVSVVEEAKRDLMLLLNDWELKHKLTESEWARVLLGELHQRAGSWVASEREPKRLRGKR